MAVNPQKKSPRRLSADSIHAESVPQESTEADVESRQFALNEHKVRAEIKHKKQAQIQGLFGKLFGDKEHAPVYAVCTAVIGFGFVFGYLAIFNEGVRTGVVESMKAIFVGALGYFAGIKKASK